MHRGYCARGNFGGGAAGDTEDILILLVLVLERAIYRGREQMEMKKVMKTVFIFAAVCLGLLAGCASQRQVGKSVSGHPQKFESRDDFKIEMAVYAYLLEKHPWDNGGYTAIFLEGSDDRVAALIRKFPNHVPPIKPSNRAQLRPNQAPIDKDTGKPALILSAKAMDPTNDVSEAIGTWYAGEAVSGLCAFVLMKVDGQWTIQSAK
jgi:hypothetical protein